MKSKSLKRFLATTVAAVTVMSSALTVCSKEDTFTDDHSKSGGDPVVVAGDNYNTPIAGVYAADSLRGIVPREAMKDIKEVFGLTASQRPSVSIYDTTTKNIESEGILVDTAEKLGAEVVACLEIDLGMKENGKWVDLPQADGSVTMLAGLPEKADRTASYSILYVQPGGETWLFADKDDAALTVTFEAFGGYGAYAIIKTADPIAVDAATVSDAGTVEEVEDEEAAVEEVEAE